MFRQTSYPVVVCAFRACRSLRTHRASLRSISARYQKTIPPMAQYVKLM